MEFRRIASVDGRITPLEQATISILDRGFLYGDSIYEVFRTYEGVPLFYDEHLERLENSARMIGMRIAQSREEITQLIWDAVQASGAPQLRQEVFVRYHVTRGVGPIDLFPDQRSATSVVIIVKELPLWPAAYTDYGVSLQVTAVRRNPVEALDPNIKSGNYLNNVMGVMEAKDRGADDCLMLNPTGGVTESSNSNVFFVLGGEVVTPSQQAGNLRGLTKCAVVEEARRLGIAIVEREIPSTRLSEVTEAFLTSATREVMPVSRITREDGQVIELPPGGGPQTRRLAELYRGLIQRYVHEHASQSLFAPRTVRLLKPN